METEEVSGKEYQRQIWEDTIGEGGVWNLKRLLHDREHSRSTYPGRPEIIPSEAWNNGTIKMHIDLSSGKEIIHVKGESGREYDLPAHLHRTEIVAQTFDKLIGSLKQDDNDVINQYIHKEFEKYNASPATYGVEILLFDELGDEAGNPQPCALLQLPALPIWKLAITLSNGNIANDKKASVDWYTARLKILSKQHIAVAGASVASQATIHSVRLIKPYLLTITDPKGPNASNFNRTDYSLTDILYTPYTNEEISKAIALARRIHQQDPFQLIHIYPEGVNIENINDFLSRVSILIEAIDHFPSKLMLLKAARSKDIPTIQLVDILSRGINGFNSYGDEKRRIDLFYGLSDKEIAIAFENPDPERFAITAVQATGAENALDPSIISSLKGNNASIPFKSVPQSGDVAGAAGIMAARNAAMLLIEQYRNPSVRFRDRQQILDLRTGKFIHHRRSSLINKIFNIVIKIVLRSGKFKGL